MRGTCVSHKLYQTVFMNKAFPVELTSKTPDAKSRISMTTSCIDTEEIPKVHGAGTIMSIRGQDFQVMHNGVKIVKDCYYGEWMTEVISRLKGHHEPQEELAFFKIVQHLKLDFDLPRKPVMIELGSFWAYYSLWFLEDFPEADVYCVEPDLTNLEVGKLNFESNSRKGTFIHSVISKDLNDFTTFITESANEEISVRTFRFEEFSRTYNITEVDILLLDIQGAELECLKDLAKNLDSISFRYIIVSTHDLSISGSATTHQDCLKILNNLGAHIIVEHSISESFSGDGLIVASFSKKDNEFSINLSYNRSKNSLFGEWEIRMGELMEWVSDNFGENLNRKVTISSELENEDFLQKEKLLIELVNNYETLLKSKSWKITMPLRYAMLTLKKLNCLLFENRTGIR